MSLQLVNDRAGAIESAAYLGVACELAYLPEASGVPGFQEKLGLTARLISVGNTQAYVGENDQNIVVAFRGSEAPDSLDGFQDWLVTNANNFLILPEGEIGVDFAAAGVGARFHRGFLGALALVWTPVFTAVGELMQAKERPLWVTGHSLGGALALVASWRFQQQFLQVHEVITFGAPMVGNQAAADAFQREFSGKIFRFIDALDVVPLLPTISLVANAYIHCQAEQVLGDATAADAAAALESLAEREKEASALPAESIWSCLKDRIAHHMVSNYLEKIAAKIGG